jgi:Lrp/AsnC family transcriptional regulator for asnA, asnC and gidA
MGVGSEILALAGPAARRGGELRVSWEPTLSEDRPLPVDETDLRIIACLRADARTTNKEIAQTLRIAESTVAVRIRSLSQRGMMRIVLVRDIRALGYDLLAHLDIYVEGRASRLVAEDLAQLDEVASVAVFPSSPQLIIHVHARSRHELSRFMTDKLSRVEGVQAIETSITLEVIKYVSEFAGLRPE